jgi:AraC-like DNA-binding protein
MMALASSDVFQKSAATYEPRGRLDPAGFQRHVQFETHAPPDDLAPFVEHFWLLRWERIRGTYVSEEVMHRPYVDVFVASRRAGIQGTFLGRRSYVARGTGRIVGARLRPGAFHAFAPTSTIRALRDKMAPLARVFQEADARWVAQVRASAPQNARAALVELLRGAGPRRDPNIRRLGTIIARLETDPALDSVAAVARACGRSERWVQQLFLGYLGVGLKWLLQRHRLLQAAARIRETERPAWAALAHELGYSSQQHFNTDLKKVLGRTPTEYKKWTSSSLPVPPTD